MTCTGNGRNRSGSATDALYPLILDSVTEGVFTVDADFRITYLNAAGEEITGIARDQAKGRKCYEVLRGTHCQEMCALRRSIETGEPQRNVRTAILNVNMENVPLCVSTSALRDAEGRLLGGVETFRDISDIEALRSELSDRHVFGDIVGASPAMQEIFRVLPDVAEADAPVLIEGPSGTGKELVAQAIHDLSPRGTGPFVAVNCNALPDTLLESELFGYVRGAFTDARGDKEGHFQRADNGTLFLDEIGDVSPAFQAKLLRALQQGEVQPLGATQTRRVDVRIIAATNRSLKQLVEQGRYREDLFYRLRVIPISIPPLRERREDIIPLVEHYVSRIAARTGKAITEVAPDALAALYDYSYQGNVRELINILERAFVMCRGQRIDLAHLPPEITVESSLASDSASHLGATTPAAQATTVIACPDRRLGRLKPSERKLVAGMRGGSAGTGTRDRAASQTAHLSLEARALVEALDEHGWHRTATARALGISRSTLWRLMKQYNLT